jgi:hypothetical protein
MACHTKIFFDRLNAAYGGYPQNRAYLAHAALE